MMQHALNMYSTYFAINKPFYNLFNLTTAIHCNLIKPSTCNVKNISVPQQHTASLLAVMSFLDVIE